ncbi:MAG: hypothetical protein RLZZ58_725 [Pseudomonadota bacterium]
MNYRMLTAAAAAMTFALGVVPSASAQMPSWSPEQQAVWSVVSQSWVDDAAQNGKWPKDYADPQILAWSSDFPSPRGLDSIDKWTRFGNAQRKTLQYEITPQAIALSGNTAVVTYTLAMVSQRGTDKPENVQEAIVETLVRNGGSWKFLATTSHDLK